MNDNGIAIRRAPTSGSGFGPNEAWTTNGFYGNRGTFFADVTGDGKADAIALNDGAITVRRASASSTSFNGNEAWTTDAYYGTRATLFGDVNADGKADAVAVNEDGAYVRLSTGSGFQLPPVKWVNFAAGSPAFGTVGVYQSSL